MSSDLNIKRFLAFEKENDLFSLRMNGWSIWRVMRNSVFRANRALPINELNRPPYRRILQAALATLKFCVLIVCRKKCNILVKTCQSGLRLKEGDKYKDIYFDSILPYYQHVKLEEKNNAKFDLQSRNAAFPSSLDPVFFTFWGKVLGFLFPVKQKEQCKKISTLLNQKLGLEISEKFLLMRISTVYWQAKLYGVLLSSVKPAVVLVSDTGEYALKLACCEYDIKMVELQHGVFDSDHPDAIPYWVVGSNCELLLPDLLACKGDFWLEALKYTRQGELAISVGNNLIDAFRMDIEKTKKCKNKNHLSVVVTSQGLDSENLVLWIKEIGEQLKLFNVEWTVSLKLHPAYDSNKEAVYKLLTVDMPVEVIPGSCHPSLFELLVEADAHLSISSASHFDALALGVPSIVIPLTDAETIQKYTNENYFFYSNSPSHAAQILRQLKSKHTSKDFSHKYSEPNFVANMKRIIG